jgi:hypothetical protein
MVNICEFTVKPGCVLLHCLGQVFLTRNKVMFIHTFKAVAHDGITIHLVNSSTSHVCFESTPEIVKDKPILHFFAERATGCLAGGFRCCSELAKWLPCISENRATFQRPGRLLSTSSTGDYNRYYLVSFLLCERLWEPNKTFFFGLCATNLDALSLPASFLCAWLWLRSFSDAAVSYCEMLNTPLGSPCAFLPA